MEGDAKSHKDRGLKVWLCSVVGYPLLKHVASRLPCLQDGETYSTYSSWLLLGLKKKLLLKCLACCLALHQPWTDFSQPLFLTPPLARVWQWGNDIPGFGIWRMWVPIWVLLHWGNYLLHEFQFTILQMVCTSLNPDGWSKVVQTAWHTRLL